MTDRERLHHTAGGAVARGGAWLDVLPVALVATDEDGLITEWGMSAPEVLGYTAREAVGREVVELLLPAEGRERAHALLAGLESGRSMIGSLTVRHRDGSPVELEVWACPAGSGGRAMLVFAVDGAAAGRVRGVRASSEAMFAGSRVGLAVFDTELRFQQVNPALVAMNGVPEAAHIGRRPAEVMPGVNAWQVEAAMRKVLATGEPVLDFRCIGYTHADPGHKRVWSCSYLRMDDVCGRPVGISTSVIDVTVHQRDQLATGVGRRRMDLLNEAGARIGTTLDLGRTAQELADVAVPRLADAASVDLLEPLAEGGEIGFGFSEGAAMRRLGLAPHAGSPVTRVLTQVGRTLVFPRRAPYVQALADRQPFVVAELDERAIAPAARYTDKAWKLLDLGVRSFMMAPLVARGQVLGAATFYRTGPGSAFDDADVALGFELATRAAMCIDNARLFSREHATALTLQRSLLPHRLEDLPGIEITHCYLPASDVNEVGGDWYDAIPLADGSSALIVGDVMGHGIEAAAAMGHLRSTVRALTRLGLPPAQLLHALEPTVTDQGEALLATCVYCLCDPATGRIRITRAGHPPPAVIDPDGTTHLLQMPAGTPLGIDDIDFATTEFTLAQGSILVLYTDGLIETRSRDLDQRLDHLTRLLTGHHPDLAELRDALITHLVPGPTDDDIALLIARIGRTQHP
ncbi:SpoIIE family protein phosphatase [Streptomyces hirsutus]|uniref:SpoIIE family protein phosphatase n=1 Tax=Streptomyces hirsutus TaxID=35620 RepID=UPI0036595D04